MIQSNDASQPIVIPPLTQEEEDEIVLVRLNNDERPLRRVMKKFHAYTSLAYSDSAAVGHTVEPDAINDARDSFLVELAQFRLLLKKSATVCDVEARQVEEYKAEKERIENEHGTLKIQIEELKEALEQAQTVRKRKMEYDLIAEKINALPSREELDNSIQSLENDMAAIRDEHETQNRTILSQKASLDAIIGDLNVLRLMGKESDPNAPPEEETAGPDDTAEVNMNADSQALSVLEGEKGSQAEPSTVMDVVEESRVLSQLTEEDNDIEMGELAEEPPKRKGREDLEEGEATDGESDASGPTKR